MRVQTIEAISEERTWTVVDDDYLPVEPIEAFLEYGRQRNYSPNTTKAYARALALFWEFLREHDVDWQRVGIAELGEFLTWLKTGIGPDVVPIGVPEPRFSAATISQRFAAVSAFYAYHDLVGDEVAGKLYRQVFSSRGGYRPFLEHVERRKGRRANVLSPRRERGGPPPVLSPIAIQAIKDRCAVMQDGRYVGSLRNLLLWSLLEDTGMRLGEALGLRHSDWCTGRGETAFVEVKPRIHSHGVRVKGGAYRKIYISDATDRLYGEWLWQLADAGADVAVDDFDETYVFVNVAREPRFAPMKPSNVYSLVGRLRRQTPEAPSQWTPHWFRHTHATALLLAGCPVHVVSRRLGHTDVQTTLNLYAWVTDDAELRALADWKAMADRWKVSW